jgi:LemA protein
MASVIDFVFGLVKFLVIAVILIGIIAFLGYNKIRALSESIKEAWSNIGVAGRKQASLINQLIDVVKSYQESEKLVMLKVSEDMSNTANVAQMYQQSGMVLSSVNGLAEKFPELKANQQYQRLIDSIQSCESQLEDARAAYNRTVREYNTSRSSIPTVFYAPMLGFNVAPYLEFEGNNQVMDMGTLKSFSADDDGERLNALLSNAGSKLLEVSTSTLNAGKSAVVKAAESGKMLTEKAQAKFEDMRSDSQHKSSSTESQLTAKKICVTCSSEVSESVSFCSNCGTKVAG